LAAQFGAVLGPQLAAGALVKASLTARTGATKQPEGSRGTNKFCVVATQ
jgi:hypothetical protein